VSKGSSESGQSQATFASSSVCDRIAFAWPSRQNRTAGVPSGEKARKACRQRRAGHSLWSGFEASVAQLRPIPAISRAIQADFSTLQTVWRGEQNSNSQYNSGRHKCRRLRKLHEIMALTGESTPSLILPPWQISPGSSRVERRMPSDSVAESGHSGTPDARRNRLTGDCLPGVLSKIEMFSGRYVCRVQRLSISRLPLILLRKWWDRPFPGACFRIVFHQEVHGS
jgi:hypothetical protein